MILCVDVGNTSIKVARVANRRVRDLCVVPVGASAAQLARAVARAARGGVDNAAVASVRPRSTVQVCSVLRRELGIDPLIVTSRMKFPLIIATRRPAGVGVDRICAASGALFGRARNALIVDAGSAITVDLVLDRRFLGGLIMPGPQMMLAALHHFTAQLPDLDLDAARRDTFDDTAPAMRTGAAVGSAGAIAAAVALLHRRAPGIRVPVWLTGGHAQRLQSRLPSGWKYVPNLTLIGLADISRLNSRVR
jgi:type III pantothenate kinase